MTAPAPAAPACVGVIDDDPAVRDSLCALLGASGFAPAGWPSAHAFLDALPVPLPDCLIVDVRMPGMSGLDLLQALGTRGLRVPVIVVTGHADVRLAVRAMKLGAADFIEKPFRPPELLATVRAALSGGIGVGTDAGARFAALTAREAQVLRLLAAGETNKAVARLLGLSPRTVETHRAHIMTKLGVRSLSQVVRLALETGFALD